MALALNNPERLNIKQRNQIKPNLDWQGTLLLFIELDLIRQKCEIPREDYTQYNVLHGYLVKLALQQGI